MSAINLQWKTKDGLMLHALYWDVTKPSAIIALVHGLGEHAGRFDDVAKYFNKHQIGVFSFDHRGHGLSQGKRGYTPSYNDLLDDVELLILSIKKIYFNVPLFLMGHSVGGNLVLNYAVKKKHDFRGIIASSPWLKLVKEPSKILIFFATMLNYIYPKFTLDTRLDPNLISRDRTVVEDYIQDKLIHSKISANFYFGMNLAGLEAIKYAFNNTTPTLIYHGTKDGLTSHKGSEQYSEYCSTSTLKLWDGLYHETHNEPEKKQVMDYVLTWIKKHI